MGHPDLYLDKVCSLLRLSHHKSVASPASVFLLLPRVGELNLELGYSLPGSHDLAGSYPRSAPHEVPRASPTPSPSPPPSLTETVALTYDELSTERLASAGSSGRLGG